MRSTRLASVDSSEAVGAMLPLPLRMRRASSLAVLSFTVQKRLNAEAGGLGLAPHSRLAVDFTLSSTSAGPVAGVEGVLLDPAALASAAAAAAEPAPLPSAAVGTF